MKKLFRNLMICTIVFLSACGIGKEELNQDVIGTYVLSRIEGGSADTGITDEEIQQLKEFDMSCSLKMNEDGTAVLDIFGEEELFTWNNESLIYKDTDKTVSYEADGTTLTITDPDTLQSLVFNKNN